MPKQIAFWIDYSPFFGYGHLARCRGLVEYLSNVFEYKIIIFVDEPNTLPSWLNDMIVKGNAQVRSKSYSEFNSFESQVIDSYLKENFSDGENNLYKQRRVWILDSNHKIRFFNEEDFIVEIEVLLNKEKNFLHSEYKNRHIKGTLIWNSVLENTYNYARRRIYKNLKSDQCKLLINLGNSIKIYEPLNKILMTLDLEALTLPKQVDIFCNLRNLDKPINERFSSFSPAFHEFSDLYYSKLVECDLLICASGNSALEAFHLDQPSLITNLFDNALDNFNALSECFKNGNFWEIRNSSIGLMGEIIETSLRRQYTKHPTKKGVIFSNEFKHIVEFFNS